MIVTNKALRHLEFLRRCFGFRSRNTLDSRNSANPLDPPAKNPPPFVPYQYTSYPKTVYRLKPAYIQAQEAYQDAGRLLPPSIIKMREQEVTAKWKDRITAGHEKINALLSNKNNASYGEIRVIKARKPVPLKEGTSKKNKA